MRKNRQIEYPLSNAGLIHDVENEIREKHPGLNDKAVEKQRNKILKKASFFNNKNKKPKKLKPLNDIKPKPSKPPRNIKPKPSKDINEKSI